MNEYQEILQLLSDETGLNVDSVGLLSLTRSINQCMKKAQMADTKIYSELLKNNKQHLIELIEEIKVPETWFFRDVGGFNYLKSRILNNIPNFSPTNPLRILSAPTSTGEEAYSAVMLAFDCGMTSDSIQVVASDISLASLEFANKNRYRKISFRNDYQDFKEKYFTNIDGYFQVSENVACVPVFLQGNLVKDDFLSGETKFDFIFCKNLLIYLNIESRKIVVNNINRLLKDDGSLLVGLSEISYFTHNGFEQVKYDMAFACQKSSSEAQNSNNKSLEAASKQSDFNIFKPNNTKRKRSSSRHFPTEIKTISPVLTIDSLKEIANKGDFVGAELICNKILQNDYTNTEALYYMGLIQNARHKFNEASDYFKKVLYMNPNHYESLVHLNLIYEDIGDSERATLYKERAERAFQKNNLSKEVKND